MRKLLIIGCFLFGFISVFANSEFENANQLYKQGQYKEALEKYQSLISSGIENELLFYNLGNTAYKLNNIALSIWAYEKALKIKPGDKDFKHNLQLANLKIKDRILETPQFFIVSWLGSLSRILPSNLWAWLSLFFLASSIIAFLFYLFSSRLLFKKVGFYKFSLFIILSIIMIIFSVVTSRQPQEAIVFAYSTTVKSEPSTTSNDLFIIHEGVKVSIVEEEDGWVHIQLPNDFKGWIRKSELREL